MMKNQDLKLLTLVKFTNPKQMKENEYISGWRDLAKRLLIEPLGVDEVTGQRLKEVATLFLDSQDSSVIQYKTISTMLNFFTGFYETCNPQHLLAVRLLAANPVERETHMAAIPLGDYRHFKKGTLYSVVGTAMHTEREEEELVIYYAHDSSQMVWARPLSMWNDLVKHPETGEEVPRFRPVEE